MKFSPGKQNGLINRDRWRFVLEADYQGVFNALKALLAYARATEPVLQVRFEPEQEKFLAYREAVVANMGRAMGLLSRREWRAEKGSADARVQAANDAARAAASAPSAAPPAVNEGPPPEGAWTMIAAIYERQSVMAPTGYEDLPDEALVQRAAVPVIGNVPIVEIMRRLKVVLERYEKSSGDLGNKIWWLNF